MHKIFEMTVVVTMFIMFIICACYGMYILIFNIPIELTDADGISHIFVSEMPLLIKVPMVIILIPTILCAITAGIKEIFLHPAIPFSKFFISFKNT